MKSIRRILVGIKDPDHGVTPAVPKAVQLARATGTDQTGARIVPALPQVMA